MQMPFQAPSRQDGHWVLFCQPSLPFGCDNTPKSTVTVLADKYLRRVFEVKGDLSALEETVCGGCFKKSAFVEEVGRKYLCVKRIP